MVAVRLAPVQEGIGTGGNIKLDSNNRIDIAGASPLGNSGIFAVGVIGSGDAGAIEITTDNLNLEDGGIITASNFSSTNANLTPGTGAPGAIKIDALNLNLTNTTGSEMGILTKVNQNSGGAIEVTAEEIVVSGSEAVISSATLGEGDGGDVMLNAQNLNLNNQGTITSSATSTGNAGKIAVTGGRIEGNNGRILAESEISGGGNISLNTTEINLNNDSLISTSVAQSDSGGGDLTIGNQETILLRNNSDIRANAFNGPWRKYQHHHRLTLPRFRF